MDVAERSGAAAAPGARLREELGAFAERHPSAASVWRRVLRHRLPVLAGLALVRGVLDGLGYQHPDDPGIFSDAARRMFSGGWPDTFADDRIQIGPLGVAFFYPIARLAEQTGADVRMWLAVVAGVCFTMGAVWVARSLGTARGRASPGIEMFVGLAVLLGGTGWAASSSGHPEEGFIALLWLLAASAAASGRGVKAGVILGVAAALKPSGALGLPLLLLDTETRRAGKGAILAVLIPFAAWAPFLAFGRVAVFGYTWTVKPHAPMALLFGPGGAVTWWMRAGQALAIVCAGAALALLFRSRPFQAVWAVPLGILMAKMLTDPLDYHYYWLPVWTVVLVGAAAGLPRGPAWVAPALAGGFYLVLLPHFLVEGAWLAGYLTMASAGTLGGLMWVGARERGTGGGIARSRRY